MLTPLAAPIALQRENLSIIRAAFEFCALPLPYQVVGSARRAFVEKPGEEALRKRHKSGDACGHDDGVHFDSRPNK